MTAVSVVVPNWNGAHLLAACLESLREQTLPGFEVIVSDDGSTDGSVQLLRDRYPEVRTVVSPVNRGFCCAANAGIGASRGEFVALINNDTELAPECLAELVSAMRADERIGICAAKMVYADDPGTINSAGQACGPDGVAVDIGRGEMDGPRFQQPREVLGASAGAALYRRRMLEEIGLLDPAFVTSVEDVDLAWRAQWAGWRAWYVPTAVVRHREGASRGIDSPRSAYLGLRNTAWVWAKHWPVGALFVHFGEMWRTWRAAAVSLMRAGRGRVMVSAAWAAADGLPPMLARRRQIRRGRRAPASRFAELLALGAEHSRRPPEG